MDIDQHSLVTPRILVIGANGYIGSNLVPALLREGHSVKATSRNLTQLSKQRWNNHPNVSLHHLDLANDVSDTLLDILKDVDIVYYLVHGMALGSSFYDYEVAMAQNVSNALSRTKISRIVYLGATQPDGESSPHLSARKATGNILRESGVQVVELRAGIIIGSGSAAFEVMRDVVSHLPIVIAPTWIKSQSCPIALETVIIYLKRMVTLSLMGSPIYEMKGPDTISYEQQMLRLARLMNKRIVIIKLPFLTPKMAAAWLSVVTSVPTPIATALVEGLSHHLVAHIADVSDAIPLPPIHFEVAVETALSAESDVVRNEIWGYDPDAILRWHKGYGYYPKHAGFSVDTDATAHDLWVNIQKVGGDEGYFFGNWLWELRGYIDAAFGGDALVKRRPKSNTLNVGDYIDSWKVIQCEPLQHLSLLFGMKAPGLGRLEFTLTDHDTHRTIDIRAWWHPAGFRGLLYWFAMMPAHLFIFKGMAIALAKKKRGNRNQSIAPLLTFVFMLRFQT
ncbi:DUF2867 domain-containing protein [Enterovibrio nigricans]|uniref:Uncharacterized conserved protein YbjT, contains NAD(P)-binding and DUF2867 domains n=1 Tax=Enterovibrio nigricans DSM 22720 TaxID=1121868 RepID=A0A1T4UVR9_9GAMM|nr:DUF2867 domain-containing protein [Enterovibrio nigricans]PKF50932.1 NAD(P)-dependent oxidoreductase [Enterovibrio nigricans]SKA56715.1 Uncharacterized conserved protein YbjT, contains NAD(P)-binding and DUF2867 domains [Enterovibrio nigricans DSM 22720]